MKLLERPIQRGAIRMFAMLRCFAVHVPNGAHLAGGKVARAKQIAALKQDGMSPGFPDLIIIDQRVARMGLVECKREGVTDLDPDQVTWRTDLDAIGIPWGLVNSLDCPIRILREWGWR